MTAIPEHPATVPLTAERWRLVTDAIGTEQPVLAELSFFTLHLWHGGDAVTLSRIGAYLLVGLTDQPRQAMVVALPGAILSAAVARPLAEYLQTHRVRFLSAPTVAALRPLLRSAGLEAEPATDDADYLFGMEGLAHLAGAALASKRRAVGRLERRHSVHVREGRLDETWANAHLVAAYDRWCIAKYGSVSGVPAAITHERLGIFAWPRGARAADVRVFALTVDGQPAGVSVVEPMWNRTWMGMVFKTDPDLPGTTPYLRRAVARAGLTELGPDGLLNLQQDDGLLPLRAAKQSYAPLRLEPKFTIVSAPADPTAEVRPCSR
jgi:hypothetical protein